MQSRMILFVVRFEPAKKTVSLSGPPMAMACWLRRFCDAVGAKLKRWRPYHIFVRLISMEEPVLD